MTKLLRLALVIGAVLLTAAATELGLRAAGYRYSPLQIGANVKNDWREQHAFHDRNLVYDPDLIWRPSGGQFSPFNPQGFRGAPVDQTKPAGVVRVIALGDSNTFGWAVDEGVNWPTRLGRLMAASRPGVEIINAGVTGYTSFQGLRRFKELLSFSPDVVLVSFGANDAHQVSIPDAEYVHRHDRAERLTRATRKLRLAQLAVSAWDRIESTVGASGTLVPRVTLDDYTSHVREIIRIAREHGIRVVLLTRPFAGSADDPSYWKTHAPAYNARTIAIGRTDDVPVIDVYSAFRDHPELFDDEAHLGVEGHRRAAEMIHAELARVVGGSE